MQVITQNCLPEFYSSLWDQCRNVCLIFETSPAVGWLAATDYTRCQPTNRLRRLKDQTNIPALVSKAAIKLGEAEPWQEAAKCTNYCWPPTNDGISSSFPQEEYASKFKQHFPLPVCSHPTNLTSTTFWTGNFSALLMALYVTRRSLLPRALPTRRSINSRSIDGALLTWTCSSYCRVSGLTVSVNDM